MAGCDAAGNCSTQSDAVSATTPAAHAIKPTTPTTDFVDNGDGTVTHRITGLTWMRCAMGMAWTGTACEGVAERYVWDQAKVLTTFFAGGSAWRLPSVAELNTIVERESYNPAINSTIFPNTPASWFWSATSDANASGNAWFVSFSSGGADSFSKSLDTYVRLASGGGGIYADDRLRRQRRWHSHTPQDGVDVEALCRGPDLDRHELFRRRDFV